MNIVKQKIKNSFNKAWETYDKYSLIQKNIGLKLMELLLQEKNYFENISDIACGTGISTEILLDHVDYDCCYAVDFSNNLLSVAKNKFNNSKLKFILADFDEITFDKNDLELIFCNMGLQWSLDLASTFKKFNAYLKDSGLLVFSMPIQNNFPELKAEYKNPTYPLSKIKELLVDNKFELISSHAQIYCEKFNSYFDAILSLKYVGSNCLISEKLLNKKFFSKQSLKNLFIKKQAIQLSYHIGFFIVRKGAK